MFALLWFGAIQETTLPSFVQLWHIKVGGWLVGIALMFVWRFLYLIHLMFTTFTPAYCNVYKTGLCRP
ncbi:hypothetical protein BU25DRAFT_121673 [Macroventuria anomochaeta]|uniref:Uncharacterized protein n=1 Tax=Macroventuria anomochaeta TaxID=301207 RepID=A0ACB6RUI3_9PLEO|nr:uncharacterized protein BU25DRAFT_121673 [Macroventuria anomochaeta]KAF2625408.1 hypothetical protein BU25DRAFT_121673 [Macroventuria anomochaeta]